MKSIKTWLYDRLCHIILILAWFASYYLFHIRNKVDIIGRENLPRNVRILYVSNHLTLIDSFLIGISTVSFWEVLFFPKRIPWSAPDFNNFLTDKIWKYLFTALKTVPVTRGSINRDDVNHQIDLFVKALEDSNLVLFFEGTRSVTGEIGVCKSGVPKTIFMAKPFYVIPIFISKSIQEILPKTKKIRDYKVGSGKNGKMVIGQAIDFSSIDMLVYSKNELKKLIKQSVVNLQDLFEDYKVLQDLEEERRKKNCS